MTYRGVGSKLERRREEEKVFYDHDEPKEQVQEVGQIREQRGEKEEEQAAPVAEEIEEEEGERYEGPALTTAAMIMTALLHLASHLC